MSLMHGNSTPPKPLKTFTHGGGESSLTEILLTTIAATTKMKDEASLKFQNLSCILDDATSDNFLPTHLCKLFNKFLEDLNKVARRHLECHINNLSRPPPFPI